MLKMVNALNIIGTKYTPVCICIKDNKLLFESEYHYTSILTKSKKHHSQEVIRNCEIKLQNQKINVMEIVGVWFHIGDGGYIS